MKLSAFRVLSIIVILNCTIFFPVQSSDFWFNNIPDSATALFNKGLYDRAINLIKEDRKYHSNASLLNFIGRCFWENYQYDSAQFYYKQAAANIVENPYDFVYSQLGQIDYALENVQLREAFDLYLNLIKTAKIDGITEEFPEIQLRKAEITYYTNPPGFEQNIRNALQSIPEGHSEKFRVFISYLDHIMTESSPEADSVLEAAEQFTKKYHPDNLSKICKLKFLKAINAFQKNNYNESIDIYENEVFPLIENNEAHWAKFLRIEYYRLSNRSFNAVRDLIKVGENLKSYIELAPGFLGDDHHRIGESYLELAKLYLELGRIELGMSYQDRGVKILEQSEYTGSKIVAYFQKGISAYQVGDFPKSQLMFEKLLTIDIPYTDYNGYKTNAYYYLAIFAFQKEDYPNALSYIEKCINLSSNELDFADTFGLKYKILRKAGQMEESKAVLSQILSRIDSIGTNRINPHIQFLNSYIQYQIDEGDYQQALKYVDLILKDNEEVINENSAVYNPELKRILVQSLYLKGQVFEKLYQHDSIITQIENAHKSYVSGINALNEVKRAYKSKRDRQSNIEQLKKTYRSGIRTSYLLHGLTGEDRYLQNAFAYAESYLSNQLLEDLNRNLAIQQTNIPDSLLLKLSNLRQQESFLMSKIALLQEGLTTDWQDSVKLETYRFSLAENKNAYNSILRHLEANFPGFYGANYDTKLVSVSKIRNKLKPSEALIEYFTTDDAVFVFCISKGQSAFLKLPVLDTSSIRSFKSQMQQARQSDIASATRFREVSKRVYDQVLHKALTAIDNDTIDKLYIIPDGELNLIPFELFISSNQEGSGEGFGSLPYLIKEYTISYAHSSSVLYHQGEKSLSDNVYFKAFAPSYNLEKNNNHKSYKRGDSWSELAFNEAEAKRLSDYFPGRVFTAINATEKSFVNNHDGATILHMAMHANVDMGNPQLSKLVFSAVNDSIFDNYLHSFEIYNMDINTQLTVLSACHTGAGSLANGEGVMSLARAFTYAGSQAVMMSHWQVDDQSSNDLMNAFYKHLSEGQSKSKALQLAKIDYLKTASPNKQHPFFWSAFVMIGDDQPIGTTGDLPWHYLLIVIPGIYFVALMYIKVKKVVR